MKLFVVTTAYPWTALQTTDGKPVLLNARVTGPEMFMPVFTDREKAEQFAIEGGGCVMVIEGTQVGNEQVIPPQNTPGK